jgi:hypothetical protein
MNINYKNKYLKYKNKYLRLKEFAGGKNEPVHSFGKNEPVHSFGKNEPDHLFMVGDLGGTNVVDVKSVINNSSKPFSENNYQTFLKNISELLKLTTITKSKLTELTNKNQSHILKIFNQLLNQTKYLPYNKDNKYIEYNIDIEDKILDNNHCKILLNRFEKQLLEYQNNKLTNLTENKINQIIKYEQNLEFGNYDMWKKYYNIINPTKNKDKLISDYVNILVYDYNIKYTNKINTINTIDIIIELCKSKNVFRNRYIIYNIYKVVYDYCDTIQTTIDDTSYIIDRVININSPFYLTKEDISDEHIGMLEKYIKNIKDNSQLMPVILQTYAYYNFLRGY